MFNFPLRAMIATLFQRQEVRGQGHKAKLTPEMYRSDQRMGVILKQWGRPRRPIVSPTGLCSLLLDVSCHWHIAYGAWYLPVEKYEPKSRFARTRRRPVRLASPANVNNSPSSMLRCRISYMGN